MRIIERPDTTSICMETIFHECKNATELTNVLAGVDPKDILIYEQAIDRVSFQPKVYVIIKEGNKPLNRCLKYVYTLQVAIDSKEQLNKLENCY